MAQFLITYDNRPPRDYSKLYQLMAAWNAVRLADSVWLANLVGPAAVIRDHVKSALQYNDVVAVVELQRGSDWATSLVPSAAADWLSNYIAPREIAA